MLNIWDTPGARRWAAPIRSALERSTCVIVCHPDTDRPRGLVEQVAGWCATSRPVLHRLQLDPMLATGERAANLELLARAIAADADLDFEAGTRVTPAEVASHHRTDSAVLHIDARRAPDDVAAAWCAFAAAAASGTKDMPASDRAAVICHVAGARVPLPASSPNLRLLWWWGALSPLDLTVLFDDPSRDQVATASIVEIARWDVDLGERLADRWDGSPGTLAGHLSSANPIGPKSGLASTDVTGPAGSAPGRLRDLWATGLADSWAGRSDPHVSLLSETDVYRRRWHAQVRVLYPWLEELRAEIAWEVAACARRSGLSERVADSLLTLELSPLRKKAIVQLELKVPAALRDVLDSAVTARNALAHLEPVDPVTLASLTSAAQAARFAPGPVRSA